MRALRYGVGTLLLLGAGIYATGLLMPVAHEASRTADVDAPADVVFARVSDVERYPAWWPDVSRVEMLPAHDGRVRFREHMNGDAIVMEVERVDPPRRLVTRIADPDQPFGGTWTFDVEPLGPGRSRVTITEHGEIYPPVFRVFARFVFGYTSTMESCLRALQAAARG